MRSNRTGGASTHETGRFLALVAAALCVALPSVANAGTDRIFDLQLFGPAADSRGLVTVDRTEPLGNLDVSFGLWVNYAHNPLKLRIDDGTGEVKRRALVHSLVTGDIHFAIGFLKKAEIGVLFPISLVAGKQDMTAPEVNPTDVVSVQNFGDPWVKAKIELLNRRKIGLGLAILPYIRFPAGKAEDRNFITSNGFVAGGKLILDWNAGPFKFAFNAGFNARFGSMPEPCCADLNGTVEEDPFEVSHEILYGFGAGLVLKEDAADLVLEVTGRVGLEFEPKNMPVEVLLAVKIFIARNSFLVLGASYGPNPVAYGSPEPRGFIGITYEPSIGDKDKDGYKDNVDDCPLEPEDFDGWEDEDGCPEPDNDLDTVLDEDDDCPNTPGDPDAPHPKKGCPKKEEVSDRDGDGYPDDVDECPDDPEDFDDWEDEDGCPDPDNDGDGILDKDDLCPNDPEDFDGWEDEDGCPELDNDGDGILDKDDACPNEPETKNGFEDEDGCPDERKRVVIKKGKILILEKIHFEFGKAKIKKESYGLLFEVGATMNDNPQLLLIRVEGHTDHVGGDGYNLKLSRARAKSVRDFLTKRAGVEGSRLTSEGYGESRPIATNETDEGRAANRRVEFVIVKEE